MFCFEGIEVDAGRGRILLEDGTERTLRPKTWEVFLALLVNRHRIVTKEELLATIWSDVIVEEGTLTRCVVEIRRALGDDSRDPRYVRTVPRVGFRFVAEVEERDAPLSARASSAVVEDEVEIEVEDVYAETPSVEDRRALPPPRRHRAAALLGVGLALGVVLALAIVNPWRRSSPHGAPAVRTRLVVLPFANGSGDQELDWLRIGLTDMVNSDLSSSGRLDVLSRQELDLLLRRTKTPSPPGSAAGSGGAASAEPPSAAIPFATARELARASRAGAFVLGRFTRLGERVRIDAQLHDSATGALIVAENATAARPDLLFAEVDALAARLLAHLGAPPDATPPPGLAVVMTANLEAFRLYTLALEKAQGLQGREAIELLEKAVALDPGFAMAHARIGLTYTATSADPVRGRPYLSKAFALSHRLTDKDRAQIAAWYSIASLDYPAAIRAYRQLARSYPEVETYIRLGRLLIGERRYGEAAEAARQAVELDPASGDAHNLLASVLEVQGRPAEALAEARRYVELEPDEPNAHDSVGLLLQARGRHDEAIAAYGEALRRKPDFEIATVHLGNAYYAAGRDREAMEQFRRYIAIGSESDRTRGHGCLSTVHVRRKELADAEREAALADGWTKLIALTEKGDLPAARELQKGAESRVPISNRGWRVNARPRLYAAGLLALRSGDTDGALALFRELLRETRPTWNMEAYEDALANALFELKRHDEAIAEYERVLRALPSYPLARYRLGLCYEAKGDKERAKAEYRRFLDDWKRADPDLAEVRDAVKRLAG